MTNAELYRLEAMLLRDLQPCAAAERLCILGNIIGKVLAECDGTTRAVSRGLFLELVDRATTNALIGAPVGSA